jgi:hypothetical protein
MDTKNHVSLDLFKRLRRHWDFLSPVGTEMGPIFAFWDSIKPPLPVFAVPMLIKSHSVTFGAVRNGR